ncbi:hypothetical protein NFI96_021460 [Prochilodus magdalenae]|nr:hypothetical protein NFI96_021460 [Prochilodus magdalenae]
MRTVLLSLTLLLLAATFSQGAGEPGGSCVCLRTSGTVLRITNIRSYYVQRAGVCHIDAVVFTTVKGLKICSDPKKPWAERAMKAVDARKKPVSSSVVPVTTGFIPTRNTTGDPGRNASTSLLYIGVRSGIFPLAHKSGMELSGKNSVVWKNVLVKDFGSGRSCSVWKTEVIGNPSRCRLGPELLSQNIKPKGASEELRLLHRPQSWTLPHQRSRLLDKKRPEAVLRSGPGLGAKCHEDDRSKKLCSGNLGRKQGQKKRKGEETKEEATVKLFTSTFGEFSGTSEWNSGVELQSGTSEWNSRVKLQSGTSEWNLRVELRSGTSEWNFRVELQSGTSEWDFRVELQSGTSEWNFRVELQSGTSEWNFRVEIQSGTPEWNLRVKPQSGTSEWNFRVGLQSGTPEWNLRVELQSGTPEWNSRVEPQSETSEWNLRVELQSGTSDHSGKLTDQSLQGEDMRTTLLAVTVMLLAATFCRAAGEPGGSCVCLRTSGTVLRITNIRSYYVQRAGLCIIDAVVFTTVKGLKICSDPRKPWVDRAMKAVDARKKPVSSTVVPSTCAAEFTTVKGRKLCSDPKKPWVERAMKAVGTRREPVSSTVAPAVPAVILTRNGAGDLGIADTPVPAATLAEGRKEEQGWWWDVLSFLLVCCPSWSLVPRFTTVKGLKICSDPRKPWVERAMKAVDARKKPVSSTVVPAATALRCTWDRTFYLETSATSTPQTPSKAPGRSAQEQCVELHGMGFHGEQLHPSLTSPSAVRSVERSGVKLKVEHELKEVQGWWCNVRGEGLFYRAYDINGKPDISSIIKSTRQPGAGEPGGSCVCLRTSGTVLRITNIRSYYVQRAGVCHIDAVV